MTVFFYIKDNVISMSLWKMTDCFCSRKQINDKSFISFALNTLFPRIPTLQLPEGGHIDLWNNYKIEDCRTNKRYPIEEFERQLKLKIIEQKLG